MAGRSKGLTASVERRGISTRWVLHGDASNERFDLAPADGSELRVFFEESQLDSVDFSQIEFASFWAAGSTFRRCDFSHTKFRQLGFGQAQVQRDWNRPIQPKDKRYSQTVYEDCVFRRSRFDSDNTHFGNVRFVRCDFENAWLRKLFTWTAEFVDCRFAGKVIECTFHGQIKGENTLRIGRSTNEFRGNDFSNADLIWTAFRGIELTAQVLPASGGYAVLIDPQSRIDLATRRAESELAGDLRDRVVEELDFLARRTRDERQYLIRSGELGWKTPRDVQDVMWRLLTEATPQHQGEIQT